MGIQTLLQVITMARKKYLWRIKVEWLAQLKDRLRITMRLDIFIFSAYFMNPIYISNSGNKHKEIRAGFTQGRRTQTGHSGNRKEDMLLSSSCL